MNRTNFPGHVKIRRAEAIERQKAHDALTPEQKIQKAQARRGKSKKELTRLGLKND